MVDVVEVSHTLGGLASNMDGLAEVTAGTVSAACGEIGYIYSLHL